MSLFTIFACMFITMRLLPPRPRDVKRHKRILMIVQWAFAPLVAALLGSTPAVDAQTRLMLGKYMNFYVTSKHRKSPPQ
jgi:hypothetical protein